MTEIVVDIQKKIPKAKFKAVKERGIIILNEETELHGIPAAAWDYKLGNRSALEWMLDQYKEKTPKDPTIKEKFNTYRFADYKDQVIELLQRVTAVRGGDDGDHREDEVKVSESWSWWVGES